MNETPEFSVGEQVSWDRAHSDAEFALVVDFRHGEVAIIESRAGQRFIARKEELTHASF